MRFHVVGLGLIELGFCGAELILGDGNAGAGVFDVRFRGRNIAIGIHGGDGDVDVQGLRSGLSIGERCVGLIERDLVIARINFREDSSGVHVLVVVHVDFYDVAGDARAERHQVAVHFGVVGGFVHGKIAIGEKAGDEQHDGGDRQIHRALADAV